MKKLSLFFLLLICTTSFSQKVSVGQILTPKGEILIWLSDDAPRHKANFIQYATSGAWDSSTFNRVIPNFVIQGGCPDTPEGFKDSTIIMPPEFHPMLRHVYGAIGFGRDDNKAMYSAKCQIYIVTNPKGEHRLDDKYTVFGRVIKGMDVVQAICNTPRNANDEPTEKITMNVNIIKVSKGKMKRLARKSKKELKKSIKG